MDWKKLYNFWFSEIQENKSYLTERSKLWFEKDEQADAYIKSEFSGWLDQNLPIKWKDNAPSFLCLIVLYDQIPRNSFRGKAQSFAYDTQALKLCYECIDKFESKFHPVEKLFLYLPLEHSERREDQKTSVQKYSELVKATKGQAIEDFSKENLDYALRHQEIIEKFGRFPHRNKILGRPSTPEELEFLKQPNSSF